MSWRHSSAFAEPAGVSDKEAFDAAKDLGTVEAWNAFLSSYPTGFHADLARAYIKKLTEGAQAPPPSPEAAPAVSANDDFPVAAGSWGGIVREGPGQQHRKVDSLEEGEAVTLMGRSDVFENGFPWFKIAYGKGGTGYQWGGILCAVGAERKDLFKTCSVEPQHQSETKCKDGGEWDGLRCRPAGFFDKAKELPPRKKCRAGEYRNQNGVCQPNETGQ